MARLFGACLMKLMKNWLTNGWKENTQEGGGGGGERRREVWTMVFPLCKDTMIDNIYDLY